MPYLSGLNGDLVFDDVNLIKKDPFYLTESNPLQCWNRSFWKVEKTQGLYRPLTLFSYWLDIRVYSIFANKETGLFPPGFRITNLILHLLVILLIYKLALRLRFGKATAFIAALIYALHPIHVEAVTPAFGRGELLCALFLLAGLLLHTYREQSLWYVIGAGFCYMFSFMSKENGAAFLPICFLMELYLTPLAELKEKKTALKKLSPFAIYVVVAGGVFCMRKAVFGTWLPAQKVFDPSIDNVIALSTPLLRIVAAVRIQGIALVKFFWPSVLSYDYSYAEILPSETIWDPYACLTLISFMALPGICIYLKPKYWKKILFLFFAYVLAILPAGNFIVPGGTIFAERLQYLPSVFLCMFTAWLFLRISRKIPYQASFVILILTCGALFARTFKRTLDWQNEMILCSTGPYTAPNNLKVWNNVSVQFANIKQYQSAIAATDKALEIKPNYATGYVNKGAYYRMLGDRRKAKEEIRKGLKISINHLYGNYLIGLIYAEEGYPEKAKLVWERILKHYPRDPRVKHALKLFNEGKWSKRTSKVEENSERIQNKPLLDNKSGKNK